MDDANASAQYGGDHMMVEDIAGFLRGANSSLPDGVMDALEAGLVAMALDEARISGQMIDMSPVSDEFDRYRLRR